MIQKTDCFICECDVCEKLFEHPEGWTLFPDDDTLIEAVWEDGWHITEAGKTYCGECYGMDDNDNLIVNPPKK